jgi:hypothetical protein
MPLYYTIDCALGCAKPRQGLTLVTPPWQHLGYHDSPSENGLCTSILCTPCTMGIVNMIFRSVSAPEIHAIPILRRRFSALSSLEAFQPSPPLEARGVSTMRYSIHHPLSRNLPARGWLHKTYLNCQTRAPRLQGPISVLTSCPFRIPASREGDAINPRFDSQFAPCLQSRVSL